MPPKKIQPNKKTVEKQKDKVIEDKTFGIKNKKGKKQQQYISNVTNQVKYSGKSYKEMKKSEEDKLVQKENKATHEDELSILFKPVVAAQKIDAGADPKSVVCAFFKQGLCKKGTKCKFSHDLSIERNKSAKRSAFVDLREVDKENDTMDKWDQEKLEMVVGAKHSKNAKAQKRTDIICKYFIDAVEKGLYGWFWECPNGNEACIYRHALPLGYILLKDKIAMEAQIQTITIEELVEKERAALIGKETTKVTEESFRVWKELKRNELKSKAKVEYANKKACYKAGHSKGVTGKELFTFDPSLAENDDDEADNFIYSTTENGEVTDDNIRNLDTEYSHRDIQLQAMNGDEISFHNGAAENLTEDSTDSESELDFDLNLNCSINHINVMSEVEIDKDLFMAESLTSDLN